MMEACKGYSKSGIIVLLRSTRFDNLESFVPVRQDDSARSDRPRRPQQSTGIVRTGFFMPSEKWA